MAIGNKIKRIQTFRNMTQRKVGEALGWGEKGLNRLAQYETNYASLHQLIFKFLFSCIAFCIRPEAAHQNKPLIYFIKAIVAYLCYTIRHINSRQTAASAAPGKILYQTLKAGTKTYGFTIAFEQSLKLRFKLSSTSVPIHKYMLTLLPKP